jgi:hypothetical protein
MRQKKWRSLIKVNTKLFTWEDSKVLGISYEVDRDIMLRVCGSVAGFIDSIFSAELFNVLTEITRLIK